MKVATTSAHCNLCLHTKAQRRSPIGELQPLAVPEEHWNTVSVNFILKLLESGGYNTIMVVVNSIDK